MLVTNSLTFIFIVYLKINVREFVTGTAKDKSEIDNKNKC
jgi:hypothetical protein